MSEITIFSKYADTDKPYHRHINHVLNRIKTGANKELIDRIRITGNAELKKQLPCILFSGEFSKRNANGLLKHSGYICLDFDKFPDSDTLLTWKDTLQSDEYTYCVFLSPSGYGLKCIVKIPANATKHKAYFSALQDYYGCEYFDKACKDVCRICFESYDPYLTINQNSTVWIDAKEYLPQPTNNTPSNITEQQTANNLLKWWNKKYGLHSGGRNANVFILCAAFNDYGVNKSYAKDIALGFQQEDFKADEIVRIINNAYRKTDKFATLKF